MWNDILLILNSTPNFLIACQDHKITTILTALTMRSKNWVILPALWHLGSWVHAVGRNFRLFHSATLLSFHIWRPMRLPFAWMHNLIMQIRLFMILWFWSIEWILLQKMRIENCYFGTGVWNTWVVISNVLLPTVHPRSSAAGRKCLQMESLVHTACFLCPAKI